MGRNRRRKLERQREETQRAADPARAARLRAQRADEAELRAKLDSVLRRGSDLSAQVHYHKLGKDAAEEAQPLTERLQSLLRDSPDRLGDCIVTNGTLEQECRRLEDRLAGKDDADGFAAQDELLDLLPKAQADAIRLIMDLQDAAPALTDADVEVTYEAAKAMRVQMTELLDELRALNARAQAIAEEKIKRGWTSEEAIARFREQFAEQDRRVQGWIDSYSSMLDSMQMSSAELLVRRSDLKHRIGPA